MGPKFYNSNGTLTKYALFCGYVQSEKTANDEKKQLYIEHNHIHVKKWDSGINTLVWEVFNSNQLSQARKLYNSLKLN